MTANASSGTVPVSDLDPYSDAALLDPWPVYRPLRDAGPAVWLPQYKMFALTRHASVRAALRDSSTFASAYGVMMNEPMNQVLRGNTLCSDGADHDAVPVLMVDYVGPSLDTTIFAITSAVWLFAQHPDQWDLVLENPKLIPSAVNEVLRMEAPIQGFSRYAVKEFDMDGVTIPADSRAISYSTARQTATSANTRTRTVSTCAATRRTTWRSAPGRTCAWVCTWPGWK
jgi:cytochrome P450